MIYLDSNHQPLPDTVVHNGMRHRIADLMASESGIEFLVSAGIAVPHAPSTDPAPLGQTWEQLDGVYVGTPIGTPAEIAAALAEQASAVLEQWRAEFAIEGWRGRVILASMPAATDGPIANFSGASMWNQIETLCQATLSPAEFERFRGTMIWQRSDPQILGLASVIGLTDAQIDDWFRQAAEVK